MSYKVVLAIIYYVIIAEPVWSGSVREIIDLSLEDKKLALSEHNRYRRGVQPTASNMEEMIWDPELADFAVKHSRKCEFSHSSGRSTSNFNGVGENLYLTSQVKINNTQIIRNGLQKWFNENSDYTFDSNSCALNEVCGHYTQMVWATSYAVGCGVTKCSNIQGFSQGSYLVCNYGPAGNVGTKTPYKSGVPCSECGSKMNCSNSLCSDENRKSKFSGASYINPPQVLIFSGLSLAMMKLFGM